MAKKIKEETMKVEVQEAMDMDNLVGVIKSEMDDAKDFIHQVGSERAESTEYYLGRGTKVSPRMNMAFTDMASASGIART